MPEGHTVHRLARDHQKWIAGKRVLVTSPQGRFAGEARRLSGTVLRSVEAHGKHLFYQFEGELTLHIHLGLYGKFRLFKTPMPEPRGEVRVRVVGDSHGFDLNGPNQCELITRSEVHLLRARLGVDPLIKNSDPEQLWKKMQRSKKPIGTVLLDQSMVAGIGNIYRAEILFLLGMHPNRPAREISRTEFQELWALMQKLLEIGVRYNRIITVARADGERPLSRLSNTERLHIYKKEVCPRCEGLIEQSDLAGRALYYCGQCQRK